jgi:hypothetical protein
MFIVKEAINELVTTYHVVVGVTAVLINPLKFQFQKGILLRTPESTDPVPNDAPVWIGSVKVTADSDTGTGGFPLIPGASLFIPVEFAKGLYVISTDADQDLAVMAV